MNNFDSTRFGRYAKLDLTINRSFYRNLALVLFATIVGVTVISFMIRWLTFSIGASALMYNSLSMTAFALMTIMSYAFVIMAGCLHHPMRNKQGRITHLTLPATNLEKYLWHLTVCIGGCMVVSLVSVAVADLINFLLSWMVFKSTDGVHSLFAYVFTDQYMTSTASILDLADSNAHANMNGQTIDPTYQPELGIDMRNIIRATYVFVWVSILFESALYAIGNALRYKFNIPITYVILQFVSFAIAILIIIIMVNMGDFLDSCGPDDVRGFIEHLYIYIYILAGITMACGIAIWMWAYKIYTKSQITNLLNK